ncbi:2-polyprenyl-6-methoxyphenol hydroxylase-like FAD-dependent oxidoreductase [Crossiella equi]|uniref:2-polyprenyl-6-methoxyphenol hydroxylase-like FAD-dependent oxidoreductase n=1 Tax=Crossiella equi TaxID=130796 RepID=A0ABS5A685_9PSEU|nr:FAD-dependent monooxygenase [Crossiella equi]MBP2472113.1 2-polyprenyl-6-methoxyphenol hydroxylase-like FAD-dependent oxidoreductase [Crossiella equi]
MTEAIIIGGGIGGPVAAMALLEAGIRATVHEAYPAAADGAGSFMSIFPNGVDALAAIGAAHVVTDHAFLATGLEFFGHSGKQLGAAPMDPGPHTLKRTDLHRALRAEALARGVEFVHDSRLVAARTEGGRVSAEFADGRTATADLVIGADGVHSRVRTLIDPDAPAPRFLGLRTICGYAPVPAPAGVYRMTYGKRAFFGSTASPDGETWWFATVPGPELTPAELREATDEHWRGLAAGFYRRDRSGVAELVEATTGGLTAFNSYDLAHLPHWSGRRMVVLGDAAHAAAPNAGHGASMAMEDAVVLAQCLRDLPVEEALTRYEAVRRPRTEQLVATSARMGGRAAPGFVKRVLRDLMLPRLLANRPRNASTWLTSHHIDWSATPQPGS